MKPSAEQIGQQINQMKSSQRLLMMDKEKEEFNRVAVAFGGLADLMDKLLRIAWRRRRNIPYHEIQGCTSAKGLNATGEG